MNCSDIKNIAVVGAGQMGQGIAQVCASAGYSVKLCDLDEQYAIRGKQRIEQQLERSVAKGRLSSEAAQEIHGRIEIQTADAGASSAQVAIEAISEQLGPKLELFSVLDRSLPERALILSNTSSISITQLAAATKRAESVAGMHFMNPVPVMKLVEVVQGVATSEATVSLVSELATKLGKTVVVSQDRPGFIVNRVLIPMLNEACFALQESVASRESIDAAICLGLNHPMGPLKLADLIGLDTVLAIAEVLHRELGEDKYRPAALLRNLVAAGYLGRKAGRGFYEYS